jgi:hypothetical protein
MAALERKAPLWTKTGSLMQIESNLNAILKSALGSYCRRFVQLDDLNAHFVLSVNALMKRSGEPFGAERHRRLDGLLGSGIRTEADLRSWVREFFPGGDARLCGICRKQADRFVKAGIKIFVWKEPFQSVSRPCPAVLFGKGPIDFNRPLFAVFNSRKPRLISPDSDWLRALRFFFLNLDLRGIALAGSTGTLTHDLVGAHAVRSGLARVLALPFPVLQAEGELFKIYGEAANEMPVLSCMLDSFCRPRPQALVCRDRILGRLADIHLILEVRSRGNLSAALEEIQEESPRHQLIYEPAEATMASAGNKGLFEKFPKFAHTFGLPKSMGSAVKGRCKPVKTSILRSDDIAWDDYLFHYTRGCAGPWPGEACRDYLLGLFDGCPLSGHSALDTLIRIMREKLIRAGSRMVRGSTGVISWSSHPPRELFLMRKWNRALVRWTVEPYGIAVRRDILRSLGAKPAVYGSDRAYSRLAEAEKYRFQLSRSSSASSWRHEREWRVSGDLALGAIRSDGRFVFVRAMEEKEKLLGNVNPDMPVAVLDA